MIRPELAVLGENLQSSRLECAIRGIPRHQVQNIKRSPLTRIAREVPSTALNVVQKVFLSYIAGKVLGSLAASCHAPSIYVFFDRAVRRMRTSIRDQICVCGSGRPVRAVLRVNAESIGFTPRLKTPTTSIYVCDRCIDRPRPATRERILDTVIDATSSIVRYIEETSGHEPQ